MARSGCLHYCLTETCAIYRIGITRIGMTQVTDGVLTVLVGAAHMWMNEGTIWSGIGVWTGLPFMLAGVVSLFSRRKRPRGRLSAVAFASIVAMVAGGFLFSTSAYNVDSVIRAANITDVFPKYILTENGPLIATDSLLMALSLVAMVMAVWAASISMGIVCACCPLGKDQVFTIPYEGMDNEGGPGYAGPRGPDIVPTPFEGGPGPGTFFEELDDPGPSFPGSPDLVSAEPPQGMTSSLPPVLHIEMDLEWDEMDVPEEEDPYDLLATDRRLKQFGRT